MIDRIGRIAVVLTVIEVAVLVEWLVLTRTAAAIIAAGFLFAGILVEELIRFRLIRERFPQGRELGLVVGGVVVETVAWILPLALRVPIAQTFGILFAGLTIEHAIINIATRGGGLNLRSVLDFSIIEAAGGAIWLVAPSAGTVAVLAITSLLEHTQGTRQGLGLR